jgi:hypothetical protein
MGGKKGTARVAWGHQTFDYDYCGIPLPLLWQEIGLEAEALTGREK